MDKRAGYQCPYITASLVLTSAAVALGICFFSPYWLQNIGLHPEKEKNGSYVKVNGAFANSRYYPDRGLWAQCGAECVWFWSSDYTIQTQIFTPLKWHLATQVMYFIAGVMMLTCEIYARVQMCCSQKSRVVLSLGILVLASALLQIASFATFGGGAFSSYNAISDPRYIVTNYTDMGSRYWDAAPIGPSEYVPFIGWSFWIGVVGAMLSVISAIFFLITYCGLACTCCPCCD